MEKTEKNQAIVSQDLQEQRDFINKIHEKGFDFGIVISEAFVRGMRDLGYKSTGTALDELIDNSIQAEASQVHIVFGYYENNKSKKKPNMIAVIDDGHGMDPEMIRIASIWGGTHREDDRKGFGRYGYGLPSACVSIGKQFRIFSKVHDGNWHQVSIDIDDIGDGKYVDKSGKVAVPLAVKAKLPDWVGDYISTNIKNLDHGTVVLIDKIDRLDFSTVKALKDMLLQHFGVTYRNYLRSINLAVDETKVEGIDPLFITPGLRYFDEDDDRAEALPELHIEITDKETKASKGIIKARFAFFPLTFLRKPEHKYQLAVGNNNRFKIRKDNLGIIIQRAGRQIDVINSKCPWTTFQNNDRYWGIEIDFPPTLDEDFSITTSKQQVVLKERIWDILKDNGVYRAIQELRNRYKKEAVILQEKIRKLTEQEELQRAEQAMLDSKKYFTTKPDSPKQQEEKIKNLEKEAETRAEKQGRKIEDVKKELETEVKNYPYKIYETDAPEGSYFYWTKQIGGQIAVYINRSHRFYSELYKSPSSNKEMQEALKVVLYVLSECELSASEEIREFFYKTEKTEWSRRLDIALKNLSKWQNNDDDKVLEDEIVSSENNID